VIQGRAAGWLAYIAVAWYLAHRFEQRWSQRLVHAGHAVSLWLTLYILGWSAAWSLTEVGDAGTWRLAAWGAVAIAALRLLPLHGYRLAWPFARFDEFYRAIALAPVALFAALWVLFAFGHAGAAAPLPFLPLVNPLDLVSAGCLFAVVLWWREACEIEEFPLGAVFARALPIAVAALGFLWLNVATARAVHGLAGVGYSLYWMHRSPLFQGCISVLWGVTALAVMVLATRRGTRTAWMTGAALLGALVVKLFLVDLGDRGTVARIVSFIGAGGLMVLIGYLSPAPPRKPEEVSA
jgi:uncharacterized membrane protein